MTIIYIIVGVALVLIVGVVIVFLMQNQGGNQPKKKDADKKAAGDGQDRQYIDRLCQLVRIVLDRNASDRHDQTAREIKRLGEQINEAGGFRRMVSVQQEVQKKVGERGGGKLSTIWIGVGQWKGRVR